MGVVYKVVVMRVDSSQMLDPEILFEAGSPNAERLVRYAADEVLAALAEAAFGEVPRRTMLGVDPSDVPPLAEPVEGEPSDGEADPEAPAKPKRTRRTKAQIEADKKAAEAAAAAPAPATVPDPPADPDDRVYGEAAQSQQAPASPLSTGVESPLAEPLPTPAPGPAAPAWNPFAPK